MAVRSDRLGNPTLVAAAGNAVLFTTPALETWLVKRLTIANPNVVAGTCLFALQVPTLSLHTVKASTVPAQSAVDLETWWPFDPGAKLYLLNNGAVSLEAQAWGAKLSGAA